MTNILVNPNELQQLANTLDVQMREMESAIRNAYEQVSSIHDSAKGLNDVRSRARDLYRQHTTQMEHGSVVTRFVQDTAQRFVDAEHDLTSMIGSQRQIAFHQVIQNIAIGGVTVGTLLPSIRMVVDGLNGGIADWKNFYGKADKYSGYLKNISDFGSFISDPDTTFGRTMDVVGDATRIFQNELKEVNGYVNILAKGVKYGDLVLKGVENGDWSGLKNDLIDIGSRAATKWALGEAAKLIPGVGTVLLVSDGIQLVGNGVASGLEFFGMKEQAASLRNVLEVIDVKEQAVKATKWVANKVVDGVGYAIQHPHEVMKQATDFVDNTANQVRNATSNIYNAATSWWHSNTPQPANGGGGW
jgi:prophage DNA circulation protein